MKIFHPLMNFLSQANEDRIKAIKKNIYIYIYTHTHFHHYLFYCLLPRRGRTRFSNVYFIKMKGDTVNKHRERKKLNAQRFYLLTMPSSRDKEKEERIKIYYH